MWSLIKPVGRLSNDLACVKLTFQHSGTRVRSKFRLNPDDQSRGGSFSEQTMTTDGMSVDLARDGSPSVVGQDR